MIDDEWNHHEWNLAGAWNEISLFKIKEYYEIVGESRPLSAFFPKHADFLQQCISNHET